MKKFIALAAAICLALSLCGCAGGALEDGLEVEFLYDLSPFGALPAGCCRFAANGMTAVFELGG